MLPLAAVSPGESQALSVAVSSSSSSSWAAVFQLFLGEWGLQSQGTFHVSLAQAGFAGSGIGVPLRHISSDQQLCSLNPLGASV